MPQDPLHLLCIEPRFPGRLGAVADWLVRRRGYRCEFYCNSADNQTNWPAAVGRGLDVVPFNVGGVAREPAVPWTRGLERGLCYAYGCWEILDARRPRPVDLVLGRSAGLGSSLFAPVSLAAAPVVNLFDHFLHAHSHDLTTEVGPDMPADYFHWRRAANAMDLLDLENGVHPWVLTQWQRDLYPPEYRADFTVLFDGVDTQRFQRRPMTARILAGRTIPAGTRVVSFVARGLDRLRGLDRFLELANRLLRARSDVICVVAGRDRVHCSLDVEFYDRNYREYAVQQLPPHDPERLWFLGELAPDGVAELLAASDLHVYASRDYAVARSLVEAMASGCVVLAWDTPPVREFVTNGQTGLFVPSDDADARERRALDVLSDPAAFRPLGEAAAQIVRERYAQDVTLPTLARWFEQLVE